MRQIPLSKGHFAVVDDADYPLVSQFKWTYDNGYAVRKITISPKKYRKILLHRFLTSAPHGKMVDHADGDRLNNCRCNLRICDGTLNNANRRKLVIRTGRRASQFRGVRKEVNSMTWNACIGYRRQRINLGNFPTEEQAAKAYDTKAVQLFGEFAVLNFP